MSEPTSAPASIEYLDAGGVTSTPPVPRPRRRTPRWVPYVAGAVAFLLTLVVAGAVFGDWMVRNVEMRALVTQIESSESAMGDFQSSVQEIIAKYQGQGTLTTEDQAALNAELAGAAAKGRRAIAAAGDNVAGVRWLAWHRDVGAAQAAYLAHNQAWQDYLGRAVTDPTEFAHPQDEVNKTFAAAEDPIRAAVPVPAMFDLAQRVDEIFAPQPSVDGGPTQQA